MNTPESAASSRAVMVSELESRDRPPLPGPCAPTPDLEDPRVIAAVQEYLAALEGGKKLNRCEFVERHPGIGDALAICLAGLEFVHQAASGLHTSAIQQSFAAPADVDAIVGTPLGDFQIVREIGRGGMGVVYEAEQRSLGRRVALKILPFAAALDPKQLQRFKNEAQAAAQLHHASIVPVYGVGCERGVHYYAMQFIAGQPLSQVIAELRELAGSEAPSGVAENQLTESYVPSSVTSPFPTCVSQPETTSGRQTQAAAAATTAHLANETVASASGPASFHTVANLGIQAAEALEHAHQLGIVHRDIKPANLLVDDHGHLWITDFGLAHCQSQAGLTMTGDLVGTLRYMSPEQALAKRLLTDHRTDIYSLGITLYELLTLEPAFDGSDREELLQQIASKEPLAPGQRNKTIPRDLETIVLKAIEKSPDGRYATAQELADDLRRFLDDKPIHASRPTLAQRAGKWSRRHRSVVWAAALLLLLALIGTGVATLFIARERDRANANYERAQANLNRAYRVLDDFYMDTVEKRLPREKELAAADRELLGKALTAYEEFANDNSDEPQARLKAAEAYRRIGGIHERLGHGEQAAAAYQQALGISVKLDADFLNHPEYRQNLARSYTSLGGVSPFFSRSVTQSELEQALVVALRIQEQLTREFPANLDYQQDMGCTGHRLGYLLLYGYGAPARAEGLVRQGVAIREKLVQAKPSEYIYRRELAESMGNLIDLLISTGKYVEVEAVLHRELEVRQQLVDDFPAEPSARLFLATVYRGLAKLWERTGKWREAVEPCRQEVRLTKQVAADFPNMVPYGFVVARCSVSLGDALRKIQAEDEAITAYRGAITACQEAIRRQPKDIGAHDWWGIALTRLNAGKEAVAVWEQGVQRGADMVVVATNAAGFLGQSLDPQIQNPEQAILLAQKAVVLAPQSPVCWSTLGMASYRAGHWKEAVDAFQKALPLWSGNDGRSGFFLAMAHWHLGELEQARACYDSAVRWIDENKPKEIELCRLRTEAATVLGIHEESNNR